jgi:hypothetical protein
MLCCVLLRLLLTCSGIVDGEQQQGNSSRSHSSIRWVLAIPAAAAPASQSVAAEGEQWQAMGKAHVALFGQTSCISSTVCKHSSWAVVH